MLVYLRSGVLMGGRVEGWCGVEDASPELVSITEWLLKMARYD